MSLIDRIMPAYVLREADHVAVSASLNPAWAALRAVDAYRVPFLRKVFALRALPARLVGRAGRRDFSGELRCGIDDMISAGTGLVSIGEEPGREIVLGAIGKLWDADSELLQILPEQFASFDTPGYGKLAWSLRVDPRLGGGSWVGFDLRVGATDERALDELRRYWRVMGVISHGLRRGLLRLLEHDLGRPVDDDQRPLPGDDLILRPRLQVTHAVTIEARPAHVWPWLVRMGAPRSGLMSNDEAPGDGEEIQAWPIDEVGFRVLEAAEPRMLVLGSPSLMPGADRAGAPPWRATWAFALEPIGTSATRLLVRARADFAFAPKAPLAFAARIAKPLHGAIERGQLWQLKRRVESEERAAIGMPA